MDVFIALSSGFGAAVAALVGLCLLRPPRRNAAQSDHAPPDPPAFLLHDGRVIQANRAGRACLGAFADTAVWDDLVALFKGRFPAFPPQPPKKRLSLAAEDDSGHRLSIMPEAGGHRIVLDGPPPPYTALDDLHAQGAELALLRATMTCAPTPVWQCDDQGRVLWSNAAYDRLCDSLGQADRRAPIFDLALPRTEEPQRVRLRVADSGNTVQTWFEICSVLSDRLWLNYGADIDAVVHAETAQRNFVQTLTKTFAHLPIGLAIFDRDRRLALFNPALIDLTSLNAEFLSQKPNLMTFFDTIREKRMMPEPKDYASWREEMADRIAAASNDRYCETWSLPSGLTYRVTGRPHPDGATAFLIEDISAEVSLNRRFRSELDLSQAVLDSMDDAVAVFSQLGVLLFCNAPFRTLWDYDPESALNEVTVIEAIRQWQPRCQATPVWGDLRDFVLTLRERAAWDAMLHLRDGTPLVCHVVPVSRGATVVRFSQALTSPARAPATAADKLADA